MKTFKKIKLLLLICIPAFAFSQTPTSYDSDGDGVPDSVDHCAYVKGLAKYGGCPFEKKTSAQDRDGDGVINIQDDCADMFGVKGAKGCPAIGSHAEMADNGEGLSGESGTLFTTTSSTKQETLNDFKGQLTSIIAAAGSNFASIRENGAPEKNRFKADMCLTGAISCYIKADGSKGYFADYGVYTEQKLAAEKYYALKQALTKSLNQNEWNHAEIAGPGGNIEKYVVSKKDADANSPKIAIYINHVEKMYDISLAVENK